MYRLKFHNNPSKYLYMFKMVDGVIVSDTMAWTDITGAANAVNLRYDEVEENGIFTPVIKTSLEVTLIRRTTGQFDDIIAAEENEFTAIVVEGGELYWTASNVPYIEETSTCLFKGTLTLETYGEAYRILPEVHLTFHDKLGELADIQFIPPSYLMRLTDVLAELLYTCPNSKRLFIEYPFDIDLDEWKTLKSPRNIMMDVTNHNRKYKLNVLTKFLTPKGMVLYSDFKPKILSTYFEQQVAYIEDIGVIRIEIVDNKKNTYSEYFEFTLETTEESPFADFHSYTNDADSSAGYASTIQEARKIIELDTPTKYPIHELTGVWELARKAKYIEGTNNFGIKSNVMFPDELYEDDFDYCSVTGYNLQHRFWFISMGTSTALIENIEKLMVDSRQLDDQYAAAAYANLIGGENKLGLMIRDKRDVTVMGVLTCPALMIKDSNTEFNLSVTAISNQSTRNVYLSLFAYYRGSFYVFEDVTAHDWVDGEVTLGYAHLLNGYTANSYEVGEKLGIPQPSAIPDGDSYFIFAFVWTGNTPETVEGKYTYITALKVWLTLANEAALPSKLTVTTVLSSTRRKPVEFESEFYNLPVVEGNTALYYGGILATGLDKYDSGGLIEESSPNIIAPPTFTYKGNNATMLVHLTDMIGRAHLYDRWVFDATVGKLIEEILPELNTVTGTAGVGAISSTGGDSITEWDEVEEYGMEYRVKDATDPDWVQLEVGHALTSNLFAASITGLIEEITYQYRAYIVVDGVTYYGDIEELTTLPTPPEPSLSLSKYGINLNTENPEDTFTVYASGDWTCVRTGAVYNELDQMSGSGNTLLTVTWDGSHTCTSYFTFSSDGCDDVVLTVNSTIT